MIGGIGIILTPFFKLISGIFNTLPRIGKRAVVIVPIDSIQRVEVCYHDNDPSLRIDCPNEMVWDF